MIFWVFGCFLDFAVHLKTSRGMAPPLLSSGTIRRRGGERQWHTVAHATCHPLCNGLALHQQCPAPPAATHGAATSLRLVVPGRGPSGSAKARLGPGPRLTSLALIETLRSAHGCPWHPTNWRLSYLVA